MWGKLLKLSPPPPPLRKSNSPGVFIRTTMVDNEREQTYFQPGDFIRNCQTDVNRVVDMPGISTNDGNLSNNVPNSPGTRAATFTKFGKRLHEFQ